MTDITEQIQKDIDNLPTDRLIKLAGIIQKCHEGQFRADKTTPYFTHPLFVAHNIDHWGGSEAAIAAALSHDVLEDCSDAMKDMWYASVKEIFPKEDEEIIIVMTKALSIPPPASGWNRAKRYNLAAQQIILCADMGFPECILIKISDISHNSKDSKGRKPESLTQYCKDVRKLLSDLHPAIVANGWTRYEELCERQVTDLEKQIENEE
jgi:(p)ppGpp synthase/HD superfamily hydrolase